VNDPEVIQTQLGSLRSMGYSEQAIAQIIGNYTGYLSWEDLSGNQHRRLAEDLRRHVRIARRWNYALSGCLR